VCLRNPLSVDGLAAFLSMETEDVREALRYLHSVVVVPDDAQGPVYKKSPVRFFHPSFPDFLQDKGRCTDEMFLVDVQAHEDFMAWRCMNINGQTFSTKFEPLLSYTLKYWHTHFRSGTGRDVRDEFVKGSTWSIGDGIPKAASSDWATSADDGGRYLFWLYGKVAIGQTAIATTIVNWAREEKGILGGSFFFSWYPEELRDPGLVFPALASQLAQFDSKYKCALYDVLQKDKDSVSANLQS